MSSDKNMDRIRYGGWAFSLILCSIGVYFLWPRVHITLAGIAFLYAGVRVFNFSTFDEYEEKRKKLYSKMFNNNKKE